MITLRLRRIKRNSSATFGEIEDGARRHICFTVERPWLDNAHGVSCIPAGVYTVARRWSPKHNADVWGVENVPDRSDIEIHVANDPRELEGCIAPGTAFGEVQTATFGVGYGVLHSADALALLNAKIGDAPTWTLLITDVAAGIEGLP